MKKLCVFITCLTFVLNLHSQTKISQNIFDSIVGEYKEYTLSKSIYDISNRDAEDMAKNSTIFNQSKCWDYSKYINDFTYHRTTTIKVYSFSDLKDSVLDLYKPDYVKNEGTSREYFYKLRNDSLFSIGYIETGTKDSLKRYHLLNGSYQNLLMTKNMVTGSWILLSNDSYKVQLKDSAGNPYDEYISTGYHELGYSGSLKIKNTVVNNTFFIKQNRYSLDILNNIHPTFSYYLYNCPFPIFEIKFLINTYPHSSTYFNVSFINIMIPQHLNADFTSIIYKILDTLPNLSQQIYYTDNHLYIKNKNDDPIETINIYDVTGRLLYQSNSIKDYQFYIPKYDILPNSSGGRSR